MSESVDEFINFVFFVAPFHTEETPSEPESLSKITREDSVLLLVTRPYDRGDKSKTGQRFLTHGSHGGLTHNW